MAEGFKLLFILLEFWFLFVCFSCYDCPFFKFFFEKRIDLISPILNDRRKEFFNL